MGLHNRNRPGPTTRAQPVTIAGPSALGPTFQMWIHFFKYGSIWPGQNIQTTSESKTEPLRSNLRHNLVKACASLRGLHEIIAAFVHLYLCLLFSLLPSLSLSLSLFLSLSLSLYSLSLLSLRPLSLSLFLAPSFLSLLSSS